MKKETAPCAICKQEQEWIIPIQVGIVFAKLCKPCWKEMFNYLREKLKERQ